MRLLMLQEMSPHHGDWQGISLELIKIKTQHENNW